MRGFRFLLLLAAAVGCGSSTSPNDNGLGNLGSLLTNGTFSATINGTAWGAIGKVIVNRPTSNSVVLSATSTSYAMTMALLNVTGPKTVALTTNPQDGSVVEIGGSNGMGWATGKKVGTGTVTITVLTTNHVAGTFSFDADGVTNTTNTLQVRNGVFDITF